MVVFIANYSNIALKIVVMKRSFGQRSSGHVLFFSEDLKNTKHLAQKFPTYLVRKHIRTFEGVTLRHLRTLTKSNINSVYKETVNSDAYPFIKMTYQKQKWLKTNI